MKDILIITVNYKNTVVIENFVHSLEKLDHSNSVELVVVDSESTNETKENLKKLLQQSALKTLLIDSVSNTFYWGGVALALHTLDLDYANGPSWIIACNNDILFTQQDFLKRLLALDPNKYSVIGPTIRSSATGENLNPHKVKPYGTLEKIYLSMFYINHISAYLIHLCRKYTKKLYGTILKTDHTSSYSIYSTHGSFMIFSFQYFNKGGIIDDNFTLYGEERSIAETARKLNLDVVYYPNLQVTHAEHSSSDNMSWKSWFDHSKASYKYIKSTYL